MATPTVSRIPGSYPIAVHAPYSENFVRSVKRWLPLRTYRWDKHRRVWRFKAEQVDAVTKLLSLHYGGYEWKEEEAA